MSRSTLQRSPIDVEWLASRFDDLSKQFPNLSLIVAMVPNDLEEVEHFVDECEGSVRDPIPVINGRYSPQSAGGGCTWEMKVDGVEHIELSLPMFSFPEWYFWGSDSGPWNEGIWAMWLFRDFGRDPSIENTLQNYSNNLSCLEAYSVLLAMASRYVKDNTTILGIPDWMKRGVGISPIGLDSAIDHYETFNACSAWLFYLSKTHAVRKVYSYPKDKKLKPTELYKIDDIGLASVSVLKKILNKLREKQTVAPVNVPPQTDVLKNGLDRETRSFRWGVDLFVNLSDEVMDAMKLIEDDHKRGRVTTKARLLKGTSQESIGKLFRSGDAKCLGEMLVHVGSSVTLPDLNCP